MLFSKNIIIAFQSRPSHLTIGKETIWSRKVVKQYNRAFIKMLLKIPLSHTALPQPLKTFLATSASPPTSTLHVLGAAREDHKEEGGSGDPSGPLLLMGYKVATPFAHQSPCGPGEGRKKTFRYTVKWVFSTR